MPYLRFLVRHYPFFMLDEAKRLSIYRQSINMSWKLLYFGSVDCTYPFIFYPLHSCFPLDFLFWLTGKVHRKFNRVFYIYSLYCNRGPEWLARDFHCSNKTLWCLDHPEKSRQSVTLIIGSATIAVQLPRERHKCGTCTTCDTLVCRIHGYALIPLQFILFAHTGLNILYLIMHQLKEII